MLVVMSHSIDLDRRLEELRDWRGTVLATVRGLIHEVDPQIVEEAKWPKPSNPAGVPVWSHGGMVCTGEVYSDKVKLTFAHGAMLPDPHGLFNASLNGSSRRAIDLKKGDELNEEAFKELVRAALEANLR